MWGYRRWESRFVETPVTSRILYFVDSKCVLWLFRYEVSFSLRVAICVVPEAIDSAVIFTLTLKQVFQ